MELAGPVLDVVLPVYGLIAAGWVAARTGRIRPAEVARFSRFTFALFVPALLFRSVARTDFTLLDPHLPLAYFAGVLLVFAVVVTARWRDSAPVDAAITGLAASFSNTTMIGIPLVTLGWGADGLTLLLSIIAFHSLVMLGTATFVFELAGSTGGALRGSARAMRQSLSNPLVLAIVAGAAWSLLGPSLPAPVDATLALLGAAAVPLCLVLLGASLAGDSLRGALRGALVISALKLVVAPLVVWGIARFVVGLAPLPTTIAVLAASLPVGATVFLFAGSYRARIEPVGASILASTLLAAPVLAALLPLLPVPPR